MTSCDRQQGEVAVMGEMVHLSEVLCQLEQNTADPFSLPAASEQVTVQQRRTAGSHALTAADLYHGKMI